MSRIPISELRFDPGPDEDLVLPERSPARKTLDRAMLEGELQTAVIDYAHLRGWLAMHTRPAWTKGHMATPIQGDPGFPDVVFARRGMVLFVEFKSEKGSLTRDQEKWQLALPNSWYLWRPSDWSSGVIRQVLT